MIKIFLTGPPGSGKTTAVMKIYETLKLYGYQVGGFITQEVREAGRRIGFKIFSLDTQESDYLAHVDFKEGPRVGKYRVNLKAIENIGIKAIERALSNSDFIIVDEVGPMELASPKFKIMIKKLLDSDKPAIITIHYKISTHLSRDYKTEKENILFVINNMNREAIPFIIWRELKKRGLVDDNKKE
jgi:nucleoside-triphosphatase